MSTEAALQQFVFIRVRKWYTREDLNAAKLAHTWPAGQSVPNFGKYIEEGEEGLKPKADAHLRFTSSQCRYWLEQGTSIMEAIFRKKVNGTRRAAPTLCCVAHRTTPYLDPAFVLTPLGGTALGLFIFALAFHATLQRMTKNTL